MCCFWLLVQLFKAKWWRWSTEKQWIFWKSLFHYLSPLFYFFWGNGIKFISVNSDMAPYICNREHIIPFILLRFLFAPNSLRIRKKTMADWEGLILFEFINGVFYFIIHLTADWVVWHRRYLDFHSPVDLSKTRKLCILYYYSILFTYLSSLIQCIERLFNLNSNVHRYYCQSYFTIFRIQTLSLKHHFSSCVRINCFGVKFKSAIGVSSWIAYN